MSENAPSEPVLLESGESVRLLTMNRPERLNAFDRALWETLRGALDRAADDPEVAAVVLTGAGRAFSAGQDLSEMEEMANIGGENPPERLMRSLLGYPKPLIAAVNGTAAGFGLSLAVHCDLVFMDPAARLIAPFVGIGLSADGAISGMLPARMGWAKAAHLLLTGEPMGAAEAVEAGFAVRECTDETSLEAALAAAEKIAAHPVPAVRATKELLIAGSVDGWNAALDRESAVFQKLSRTDEHHDAIRRFLEG